MSPPLRIRHLLKGLGPGGAERLVVSQAIGDGGNHHSVAYLIARKTHLVPLLDADGIESICLEATSAARLGWVRRLRRLLRDDPCDVLHVHSPALAAIARLLARTLPRDQRPALVGTEHNRWPRHHRLTRLGNRLTIRFEDATIAVSNDVKSTIRGVAPEAVRVIIHGIDADAVRSQADRDGIRAELGVAADDVVVVCVANLRREKSLDVLVAAAAKALERSPTLRYFLVGQGPLSDDVGEWIETAGIADRFTALGYREDTPRVLSGADLFTLSSAHEGLPVSIMEALTLGLPVVATAAGGVPDAVGAGGLLSPVGDISALAENHSALAEDLAWRRRLASAAAEEASRFAIDRALAEIGEVYATAVARSGSQARSHS